MPVQDTPVGSIWDWVMDNKYFNSKSVEVRRSQIKPASYNPRTISDEGRKQLKLQSVSAFRADIMGIS